MSDEIDEIDAALYRQHIVDELRAELDTFDATQLEIIRALAPSDPLARLRWVRQAVQVGGIRRKAPPTQATPSSVFESIYKKEKESDENPNGNGTPTEDGLKGVYRD